MLKSFYNKILTAGINEGQPEYLQKKIKLTNKLVVILLLFLVLPFLIIGLIMFSEQLIVLFIGAASLSLLLVLNHFGLEKISRILISIMPLFLVIYFGISAVSSGAKPPTPIPLMAVTLSLLPFVIFDLRERVYIIFSTLITISLLLWFNNWAIVGLGFDETTTRIINFSSFLGCVIGISMFYILVIQNDKAEKKAETLINEMEKNNNLLNKSQDDLTTKLEELEIARAEEKKRNWTSEGLAQFGDMLRSDKDLVNLSDEVLSKLVKYINANQGGLYSVLQDNTDTYIKLISSYAYSQKKFNEKRIEIGQGLLGQTYKEKSYKYLTEVPQGYMEITSGLGDATPSYLLIVPMIVNDKVEGLIELSSFYEIEQYKIDFIEKLGEQIASALNNKKVDERTKKLLEETQQQAEEMRAQEEEVRQNMEELQAIQEELSRNNKETEAKSTELQQQKEDLEKWQFNVGAILDGVPSTIIIIDENNVIEDTNKSGEELSGYKMEEMVGKNSVEFFPELDIAKIPSRKRIGAVFLDKSKTRCEVVITANNITKQDGEKKLLLLHKLTP